MISNLPQLSSSTSHFSNGTNCYWYHCKLRILQRFLLALWQDPTTCFYFLFLWSMLELAKSTWWQVNFFYLRINFFYLLRTFWPHLGSFCVVSSILSIVHTWNSSPLWINLRLQCICCTVPTTSGKPHGSPLLWACQWPSSQPLSSPQSLRPNFGQITAFHSCYLPHYVFDQVNLCRLE